MSGTPQSMESQRIGYDWVTELNWTWLYDFKESWYGVFEPMYKKVHVNQTKTPKQTIAWVTFLLSNTCTKTMKLSSVQFSSVAQLCPTLWPHESQHARPPCPSPTPGVHPNSKMKSGTSDYFKDSNISWPWGSACTVSGPLTASFLFLPITYCTFFSVLSPPLSKHINH